ncbi:MAG: twin-arginine translocation signal domain-containing protein [Bryobacterales bacterium]|nr:twin-arginine translocation signal domain-containing protein [Bryobacterales bacterium]
MLDLRSRRDFLGAAASAPTAAALIPSESSRPLPTVQFGNTSVSRLIIGSNPFYGYSHFNRLLDQFMRDWMTQDRRIELLHRAARAGINTWQFHYNQQTVADFKRYRTEGGRMNVFLLSDFEMQKDFSMIPGVVEAVKPIGVAHHGNRTDDAFRNNAMDRVREFCKRVRDTGAMVGVSTHNPAVVEYIEDRNWDVDYYMTCLYHVSRTKEETRKALGEAPLGEAFLERDPERMTRAVRQTAKPCLAFKLMGAGRNISSPEAIQTAFQFAYTNIKSTDACIVGMCPRFKDEITENAAIVRNLCSIPT